MRLTTESKTQNLFKYFGAEKWDDKNNFVKKTRARIA